VTRLAGALLAGGHDLLHVRDHEITFQRAQAGPRLPLPASSVLLATGGSSGKVRVVIDAQMRLIGSRPRAVRPSTAMNWRPGQRQMIVGPLIHTATLTFFTEALCDGNTLLVHRRFDGPATLSAIEDWRVEWLQFTPYHMRHLLSAAAGGAGRLASLHGALHLAAPCPAPLKRHWLDLIGPGNLFEMYGSTEGIGVTLARGDEWLRRPGTVGRGFFTQIRVLDEQGMQLPPGETGEIYLRSGRLVQDRFLHTGHRIHTTGDGFASVGDHGHVDADGYLYLAPRQLGRIQVGGETVYPGEVESVLLDHPGVLDAGVAGIADEYLGEALIALVVPIGQPDPRTLRHYLRERLSRHKVPRAIRFVDSLPRRENGKLDRARLAALAGQATAPEETRRKGGNATPLPVRGESS
jgi:bile acid-coenzyme A ligase